VSKQGAIDRANKLLRLAGPKSGTTESERISAALEAARVIEENGLIVAEKIENKKSPRPHPAKAGPRTSPDWGAKAESAGARRGSDGDGFFTRTRSRQVRPGFGSPPGFSDWNEMVASSPCVCVACGGLIEPGERVWHASIGVRHYDITCDQFR
jgi:hypothetical protein